MLWLTVNLCHRQSIRQILIFILQVLGVKNIKYYGNGSVRITSTSRAATLNLYDSPILKVDNNKFILKKIIDLVLSSNGFF